jgi:hypothetical protein
MPSRVSNSSFKDEGRPVRPCEAAAKSEEQPGKVASTPEVPRNWRNSRLFILTFWDLFLIVIL